MYDYRFDIFVTSMTHFQLQPGVDLKDGLAPGAPWPYGYPYPYDPSMNPYAFNR